MWYKHAKISLLYFLTNYDTFRSFYIAKWCQIHVTLIPAKMMGLVKELEQEGNMNAYVRKVLLGTVVRMVSESHVENLSTLL